MTSPFLSSINSFDDKQPKYMQGLKERDIKNFFKYSTPMCSCKKQYLLYMCVEPQCKKHELVCPKCDINQFNSYHFNHTFTYVRPLFYTATMNNIMKLEEKYKSLKKLIQQRKDQLRKIIQDLEKTEVLIDEAIQQSWSFYEQTNLRAFEIAAREFFEGEQSSQKYIGLFKNVYFPHSQQCLSCQSYISAQLSDIIGLITSTEDKNFGKSVLKDTVFNQISSLINKRIEYKQNYFKINRSTIQFQKIQNQQQLIYFRDKLTKNFVHCSISIQNDGDNNKKIISSKCSGRSSWNQVHSCSSLQFSNLQSLYLSKYKDLPSGQLKKLQISEIDWKDFCKIRLKLKQLQQLQQLALSISVQSQFFLKNITQMLQNITQMLVALPKTVVKLKINVMPYGHGYHQFLNIQKTEKPDSYKDLIESLIQFITERNLLQLEITGIALLRPQKIGFNNKSLKQAPLLNQLSLSQTINYRLFKALMSKEKLIKVSFTRPKNSHFSSEQEQFFTRIREKNKYCLILAKMRKQQNYNCLQSLLFHQEFISLFSPYTLESQLKQSDPQLD